MSTLTILPSGRTADIVAGSSLLKMLLDAGEKLASKCGGEAQCGACHVFVLEGRKGISKMTPAENSRLDSLIGIGSKSRLACQITLLDTEAVTVELPGALSG